MSALSQIIVVRIPSPTGEGSEIVGVADRGARLEGAAAPLLLSRAARVRARWNSRLPEGS